MRRFLYLFAVLLTFTAFAQQESLEKIDSIIESKIRKTDPGLMVGIVKEGNIIYEKYLGLANLQHQVKITKETRSNIASTAKQFTALMILDLALKDKLSLEDDIRKYLPNLYQEVKEEIKVRHVINHTSGIRDYVELLSLKNQTWWQQVGLDNNDIMQLLEKQKDLGFAPGLKYIYSNSGYVVLAEIIEKVSGQSFNDYSKAFFEGLGMKSTSFVKRYMEVIPNRAEPYSDWGRGEWWQSPTVTKTNGEGFLFTTLEDQLIYEQAIQNAAAENNLLLIKSQQAIPNSEIQTYGFGLNLFNWFRGDRKAVHHDGRTYGYQSQTVRFAEGNLSIFIMSNNGNLASDVLADEIAKVLLPKLEIKKAEGYDNRFYESVKSKKTYQVKGQYYSKSGFLTRIEEEDGKIFFLQGNRLKLELVPEKKNVYHFSYAPENKLVFYENEMALFRLSGETSVFKRSSELPAAQADIEAILGVYENDELDIGFEIKLNEENKLKFKFSNDDRANDLMVFNRNELMAGDNLILKAERDASDGITGLLLTYERAGNMRFIKKEKGQL